VCERLIKLSIGTHLYTLSENCVRNYLTVQCVLVNGGERSLAVLSLESSDAFVLLLEPIKWSGYALLCLLERGSGCRSYVSSGLVQDFSSKGTSICKSDLKSMWVANLFQLT